jgi:transcriptional regulator GlxA family with amidase domain
LRSVHFDPDHDRLAKTCFAFYEVRMTKDEKLSIFLPERSPLKLTFLVFSGASIMCVASAVDPLRAANRISGDTLFDWKTVSADGEPPVTTSGLPVAVSGRFNPAEKTDVLIVVGGFGTRTQGTPGLVSGIGRAARSARACGGVEAGTWLVARAGLLEGRAATTHWEDMEDFAAAFPGTDVRPDRYVIDGPVFTTGGASPTFDLMLHLIRTRLGMAVALDVASVFIYDQARAATDAPRPGYSPDGIACRQSPHHRGNRQARRRHRPHPGEHFWQIHRRDARCLLPTVAPQRRPPAGSRHA